MIKRNTQDIVVDSVVYFILFAVFLLVFYPFYYAVIISFNEGVDATRGGIYLWPRKFTWENYATVFNNKLLLSGFSVTTLRTVVGTILSLFCTSIFAFTLSHRKLLLRRVYVLLVIICIYFSGGLIPYFILLKDLGLINTFAVYIVPALIFPFYVIIMMAFFQELPQELEESAYMDGANELSIFFRIILPVAKPIMATMALFIAVQHWNAWFDTAYFTNSRSLRTISFPAHRSEQQGQLRCREVFHGYFSGAADGGIRVYGSHHPNGDNDRHHRPDHLRLSVSAEAFRQGHHDRLHQGMRRDAYGDCIRATGRVWEGGIGMTGTGS